jgi:cell division protein FtsB
MSIGHIVKRHCGPEVHHDITPEATAALGRIQTVDELRAELTALQTSNRRQRQYILDLERQVRELRERIPRGCVDAIARAGGVSNRYVKEGLSQ